MKNILLILLLPLSIVATAQTKKVVVIGTRSVVNYDSLKRLFVDTSVRRNGYLLAFDSVNHKWYLTAGTASSGGTVTSIATGYGITGGPITTTGTLIADTTSAGGLVSKSNLSNNVALKVNISDTSAMLAAYRLGINTNAAAIQQRMDSLRNNAGVLEARKGGVFVPQFTLPTGGAGVTKAQLPFIVNAAGDSITRRWNVRDYGAKGDGVTNDQSSIQSAINACYAGGGGQVFFPNGVYILSGSLVTSIAGFVGANPNSQLYIPVVNNSRDSNRTSIELLGETAPNFIPNTYVIGATYVPTKKGVILRSTITGSGNAPSVIGSQGPSSAYSNFNYQGVIAKNLTIIVNSNSTRGGPTMGGINMAYNMSFIGENLLYSIDSTASDNGLPTNNIAAIIMPKANSEINNTLKNVMTVGSKYGIVTGDHTSLDQVSIWYSNFGLVGCSSPSGINASRLVISACKTSIYFPTTEILGLGANSVGNCYFNIAPATFEVFNATGNWYDYYKTIVDSSNYGNGNVRYHSTQGGVGVNYSLFNVYGGNNISSIKMNDAGWSVLGTTGQASNFIGTTNNTAFRIRTNNIQRAVIDTTGNFGAGILSPTSLGHFYNSANSSTKVTVENPTSGTASNASFEVKSTSASGYFGILSPTSNSYGGLTSNDVYILSAAPINLVADNSSIKFSNHNTGFGIPTESARFAAGTGNLLLNTTSDDGTNILQVAGTSKFTGVINANAGIAATGTGTQLLQSIGSNAGRSGAYIQATNSGSQATLYFENDRGGFGAYGGLLTGGSANANALFGISRADQTVLFNDGASGKGLMIGTLNTQPVIIGSNNLARVTVSSAGMVRFNAYGAGTLTTDASGNITATSDERLKTNITPYKTGLKELMKLNPITYSWNKKSGNETKGTYAGFSAQNVKASIPYGTGEMKDGYLTLQDRAIMATLTNSVKELYEIILKLKSEIVELKKKVN